MRLSTYRSLTDPAESCFVTEPLRESGAISLAAVLLDRMLSPLDSEALLITASSKTDIETTYYKSAEQSKI